MHRVADPVPERVAMPSSPNSEQNRLTEQVAIGAAQELEKDVEAALGRGSARDARLLEEVPVDVGAGDRARSVEEDPNELALLVQRLSFSPAAHREKGSGGLRTKRDELLFLTV